VRIKLPASVQTYIPEPEIPAMPTIAASPIRTLPGGIDLRTINIIARPMGSFSGLNFTLPKISNIDAWNLDEEMQQIKNMVQKGMIPSEERLKEYLSACYQKGELSKRAADLVASLVDICRLEEEGVYKTKPELKEILVILDVAS
jgi:hypothetical protein